MDLKNAVVLVTGAASGIGAAIASHFGKLGSSLFLVDKEQDALSCAKLEEPLGGALGGVNEAQDDIDLNDLHQEEDVVMGKRQLEETFLCKSSDEGLVLSESVKAAARRGPNDEQNGGTNKQMAPTKICLRKSGSKQVSCITKTT